MERGLRIDVFQLYRRESVGVEPFFQKQCVKPNLQTHISKIFWHCYCALLTSFLRFFPEKCAYTRATIKRILIIPIERIFCFYVRSFGEGLVQCKLPYGVLIQPSDSLLENYGICRCNVFETFSQVSNDDVVVDVGAHVGIFSLKASREASRGTVLAIEPYDSNFRLLTHNTMLNGAMNVLTLKIAVSNFEAMTKLYVGEASHAHTITRKRTKEESFVGKDYVSIEVSTIDALLDRLGISKVNFIKINVEGEELQVLKGAGRILEQNDLKMVLAVDHYATEPQEVIAYLQERNFKTRIYYNNRFVYAQKNRSPHTVRARPA